MAARFLVRDYMTRRLVTLAPQTEIMKAVNTLRTNKVSGAPVVTENGSLVGILTQKDCMKVVLNAAYHSEFCGVVADFMEKEVTTFTPDMSIVDAAQRFLEVRYHRYPVMDNGVLVGQISRSDVLRALEEFWQWRKT
jgi:CBS domain-containing protein